MDRPNSNTSTRMNLNERLHGPSFYIQTRGWYFILSWGHRLTGILLVVFVWFHIYTLSSLTNTAEYQAKMAMVDGRLLKLLEWFLVLPVIFHTLNGGRLILYESFQVRQDDAVAGWVMKLCAVFAALMAVLMLAGDQAVSAFFYWLTTLLLALTVTVVLVERLRKTAHTKQWKLQRITGIFLLVMIPAHFLFMHLNDQVARDAGQVTARLQMPLVKLVDVALLLAVLYHGWYGLNSVTADYVAGKRVRMFLSAVTAIVMVLSAGFGIQLLFAV
ncbi:MAG: succinate dehydrogenase, hydrophobic membrane anchor protein [bacterium]